MARKKKTTVDYRDFRNQKDVEKEGATKGRTGDKYHRSWWKAPTEEMPDALSNILSSLRTTQGSLNQQRQISARLYGNANPMTSWGLNASRSFVNSPSSRGRLRINITKSVLDTVQARIGKNRPKPMALTQGGHYRIRRRAQKLTQFCGGIFEENKVTRLSPRVMLDAMLNGSGFVQVYPRFGRVHMERVHADELWCDEQAAFMGLPTSLFRVRSLDRDELIELVKSWGLPAEEEKEAIKHIEESEDELYESEGPAYQATVDRVQVCEAWHLRSSPDAKDGLHFIGIPGYTLLHEQYDKDFFPFAKLDWSAKPWGYFGIGLAEEIEPQQLEINRTCWTIQESQMMGGTFKIAVKNGSQIDANHLTDEIGTIIYYTGDTPPVYLTPKLVGEEVYRHVKDTIASAYNQAGLSQASASGQKQPGLDSGAALREMEFIENDRFNIPAQNYEHFHLDLGRLAISVAKDIADATNGKFTVKAPGRKFLQEIDWKEVEMEDDEYTLQLFPVSSLPNTPAARMQTVQEWTQAGWISPRQARRLMNFPDLDEVFSLLDAVEERIHNSLEKIVDEGIFTAPDPYMDLDLAKQLAVEYVNLYATHDLEEDRLALLLAWSEQVDYLKDQADKGVQAKAAEQLKAQAAAQAGANALLAPPMPPGAPGAPQAPPVAPQPSDLVPNAPGIQAAAAA
jgi:hypothetical protein